jgi:CheY-like chemotaxis protein
MEAVGRLAGGVAHEFNNLLTAIVGHGELLSGAVGDDPELRPHVDGIREAARRGANLTQRLLAFGRRQIARPIRLDRYQAVGRRRRLLQRTIGEQIALDIALEADPAIVEADLSQIEQVIVNLALNARDAMPEGGSLRLATSNRTLDATEGPDSGLAAGQYVVLGVEDTGIGIDEEIRDLIFEPFFTTKAGDGGTGLGLAAVHGIVTRSGGSVQVRSSPGSGTTFEVSWPIAGPPEPRPAAEPATSETDVILVVDDDPGVRSLASKVLAGQGYLTLEAADGEEAFALFSQQAGRVGVLVSDVVMPGLQGPELAARLRGVDPDLKVVLMSGYTEASSDSVGSMLEPGMRFLQKPFSPADLVALVRDVSDPE